MTDHVNYTPEDDEEIFALQPTTPEDRDFLSGILLSDDQDPDNLTEAGILNAFYGRVLERLYVGERMAGSVYKIRRSRAGRVRTLVPGEISEDAICSFKHHGAADMISCVFNSLPAGQHWRGPTSLDYIAWRILLGRAKSRLESNPADEEAAAILRYSRLALGRNPETGMPNTEPTA